MRAIDAATTAGSDAGDLAFASGSNIHGAIATAMAEVVRRLAAAGCLREPEPVMTVEDAAKLLCSLSTSPRLSDPDEDYEQLLASSAMVSYAWTTANGAGIPPSQQAEAHTARKMLIDHHRRLAVGEGARS